MKKLTFRDGPIVIKIGGAAADEAGSALDHAAALARGGDTVMLVHGGGPLTSEWSRRLGLEPRFEGGLRVTDGATRDVALAVMAGLVNKRLVAALLARGVSAVGISGADGGLLQVRRAEAALGLVGEVVDVRTGALQALVDAGQLPVIAPAAIDGQGELLNVNADEIAGALAAAVGARLLVLVTDVPGVKDDEGVVVPEMDAEGAARLERAGALRGGILPKVRASLRAAEAGVVAAIVDAREGEAIARLAAGERAGTVVLPRAQVG